MHFHCSLKKCRLYHGFETDSFPQSWPVSHVNDTTSLYLQLLRSILSGENPGYGKSGYYLAASSRSVAWIDIYAAMAKGLANRKVVKDEAVIKANDAALAKMAKAMECPKEMVAVLIGGM